MIRAALAPIQPSPKTPQNANVWDDHRIELLLGKLLRAGVMLAATVVLVGGCIYLIRHGREAAEYRVFRGEPVEFTTLPGVTHSVLTGRGRGFIQLGLLILIATPISRVTLSVIGFSMEKDRMYVLFTLIVLLVLLYSLLGSGFAF